MSSSASFGSDPSWTGIISWIAALAGMSTSFPSLAANPIVWDSVKLLLLGSVIETGRRMFRWIVDRFGFRCSISAQFPMGDPTYEWLVSYLTKENVWRTPRGFLVQSKTSQRKWKVKTGDDDDKVDYVPQEYGAVHFFRWKGYWFEVISPHNGTNPILDDEPPMMPRRGRRASFGNGLSLNLTIYTLDTTVLNAFVEECRLKYAENTRPFVTVYSGGSGGPYFDPEEPWSNVKTKNRRPVDSLLLDEGVVDSLLADAREFIEIEDWYVEAGIPHRRGYLLHGPPGTGKTSTVYTVAGELGLEIYSLSLASSNMDDNYLASAVSRLPPRGILLIEDIDCAFPSREDGENESPQDLSRSPYPGIGFHRSQITLSGLLNVLDGIGSEEGKIFFATTNHIDRLDPALLRPGRIDSKIEYKLASKKQTHALFNRFFPASRFSDAAHVGDNPKLQFVSNMSELAEEFTQAIPEYEMSIAELQGYLLGYKTRPIDAARGVEAWVASERKAKQERVDREKQRKNNAAEARAREQLQINSAVIAGVGTAVGNGQGSRHHHYRPLPPASPPFTSYVSDETSASGEPAIVSSYGSEQGVANKEKGIADKETKTSGNIDENGTPHTPPKSPVPGGEVAA